MISIVQEWRMRFCDLYSIQLLDVISLLYLLESLDYDFCALGDQIEYLPNEYA